MNITEFAIKNKTVTWFATFLLVVGGIMSYFGLGQLEDPEFSIKTAVVTTPYPGASAQDVELEVTDRIELALQELAEIKNIESISKPGLSIVKVDILDKYWAPTLPQIWDKLRKKIRDVTPSLPPGTSEPIISDDFGDVYGFVLAITGDGFTWAEIEQYAKDLKKDLSLVPGVARVEFWGTPTKCIYLDSTNAQLALLGISGEDIINTLQNQNMVVDAGGLDLGGQRIRVAPTGEFRTPEDIADLVIRGRDSSGVTDELIRIGDIATVRRGYVEPPQWQMRYNGQPALAISISNTEGENIVELGNRLDARVDELVADLPIGLEVERVAWQSDLVTEAIDTFIISLIEAVIIVLIVLWASMGFRMATIIGIGGLVFVILGSFMVMRVWGIDLQRMSLGALIIAMGMMVDNAIVVADGIVVRLQKGMDRTKAAIEAATQPSIPLLGATIIAVMAFYPIFASSVSTGEYCRTLFQVVAISLMLSWVLSVTVVPLMCMAILPDPKPGSAGEDPYGGSLFQKFRGLLSKAIRFRGVFMVSMIVLLAISGVGFKFVSKLFFPDSSRLQFMVDYWAPEGSCIQQTSEDLRAIEQEIMEMEGVETVATFVGQGPPRFYLPVDPEMPYSSYGQLIVNTETLADVQRLVSILEPKLKAEIPQAMVRVRKYGVGPSDTWKFEARFSGPAVADPAVLRDLANQGMEILEASPNAKEVRHNWRERTLSLVPDYDEKRGRWTGISRNDIASATRRAYDGLPVGLFREHDELYPIILRHDEAERQRAASEIDGVYVQSSLTGESMPLIQSTESVDLEWEDPLIWRYDRRRAITVQCDPDEVTFPTLYASVIDQFNNIELPPGYSLDWGGEKDSSDNAQEGLKPGIGPSVIIMAFLVVALFNAFRQPLIIMLTIPFAFIGITFGLLVTGAAFGFMALLGAMSLSGMMIKNAIVLLDEIKLQQLEGKSPYDAVMGSALSRLRPVVLAAATTVLGMAPLLQDVFWISMGVTVMFGLAFGTVLTMIVIPVLYCIFFRIPTPEKK